MVTAPEAPKPGDLVWIDFTPTVGTEQSGRRPALVVSDAGYNVVSGRALVMPITSRIRNWPFEVLLPQDSAIAGAVLVDQIRCIDWRARPTRPAGAAPRGVLEEARGKLAALTGLD